MNWVWFWTIYEWPTVSWMNVLSFTNSNTKMYLRIRYYSYKTSNTKMCICIRYYSYKTSIKLSQRYQTTFFFTLQWYQTTQISLTRKKREKEILTILCINNNQIIPSEDVCTHGFHSPPLYGLFHIVDIWKEFNCFWSSYQKNKLEVDGMKISEVLRKKIKRLKILKSSII